MMIDENTYKIHRIFIYSIVSIFQIFGHFGNINIIVLTIRKKSVRSNYGMILATLATVHSICLSFEIVDMGYGIAITFFNYKMTRITCFYSIFPSVFFHCIQTGTICILAFDLFLTILVPLKYLRFQWFYYFPLLFILPFCYGFGIVIAGFIYVDNQEIKMCNPPSSLHPLVNSTWYALMLAFSVATVVFYFSAFGLLYWKVCHNNSNIRLIERKAMKTLKVLIIVFLLTRFITTALFNILTFFKADPELIILVQNYNVIPAVVAFSQNAYVCYFRSSEYRKMLFEQISLLNPYLAKLLPMHSHNSVEPTSHWHHSQTITGHMVKPHPNHNNDNIFVKTFIKHKK